MLGLCERSARCLCDFFFSFLTLASLLSHEAFFFFTSRRSLWLERFSSLFTTTMMIIQTHKSRGRGPRRQMK